MDPLDHGLQDVAVQGRHVQFLIISTIDIFVIVIGSHHHPHQFTLAAEQSPLQHL